MLDKLRQTTGRMLRRVSRPPAILMYHRVATPRFDPWQLAVSPTNFEAQMAWLSRYRRPMPIDELCAGLVRGKLPRGAVAVTFDDGYLDNLTTARPALIRHQVPATLFLSTGCGDQGYWWDQLADALLGGVGAAHSTLNVGHESFSLIWSEADVADPSWHASQPPPGPRERAFMAIWTCLQRTSEDARRAAINEIALCLNVTLNSEVRRMDENEVRAWLSPGTLTLGAHTVTHPMLTMQDDDDVAFELGSSRDACERLSGGHVAGFAYPYGAMSPTVRAAVVKAGFGWACSTEAGTPPYKPSGEQQYALPRITVPNGGSAALAEALA